jgi:hypothetical protein
MSNSKKSKSIQKTFDELKVIMTNALLQMQSLVENGVTQKADFIPMVSLFITGIMSTAADLSEVILRGSAAYLYSEIETAAKNGGLRSVLNAQKKGGNSYSVSNIAPDDMGAAMNYLGQELGATLFKHIHDLPKPLRTRETLLRAVESLLTNLLHQKFNDPENPHAILDSLCEHVHMALSDLEKKPKLTLV